MDGYSFARQIREQPQFRTMMLVAQTGGAQDDRLRSQEAGSNITWPKPIDHGGLQEILTESPQTDT